VRIEVLARDLAVSKGSFYWHFRDRDEFLMQMLDCWRNLEDEWLSAEEKLDDSRPSAAARWARFVERSVEPERIPEEIAVRAWARRDERVAVRVADIERRKIQLIARVLSDVGFGQEAAESWSETICLVYLGWLDRRARGERFGRAGRELGEILSDLVLAASAKAISANQ
jgi:AcrR family transcriptional regulator